MSGELLVGIELLEMQTHMFLKLMFLQSTFIDGTIH